MVNFYDQMIVPSFSDCNGIPVEAFSEETDLYILLNGKIDPLNPNFVESETCKLSGFDNRPIMAVLSLNFARLEKFQNFEFENFGLIFNEFVRLMGFNQRLLMSMGDGKEDKIFTGKKKIFEKIIREI